MNWYRFFPFSLFYYSVSQINDRDIMMFYSEMYHLNYHIEVYFLYFLPPFAPIIFSPSIVKWQHIFVYCEIERLPWENTKINEVQSLPLPAFSVNTGITFLTLCTQRDQNQVSCHSKGTIAMKDTVNFIFKYLKFQSYIQFMFWSSRHILLPGSVRGYFWNQKQY